MLFIAKELGKTLEEIMEISSLELRMWAAFYKMEKDRQKERMNSNGGHQHNRKTRR